jgi:glycerophosphoryl diester phosphodiesterase
MKTWLVAHRGAQNKARENTLQAFTDARKYDVGYIELDVRITSDNVAVIHHDPSINGSQISEKTHTELLRLDPELANFDEVVASNGNQPLIIELKSKGSAKHAFSYLQANPSCFATSFIKDELLTLQELGVDSRRMFLAQHKHPIGLLSSAIESNFLGITLNKWYLGPCIYRRAKKNDLTIFIYTVNGLLWARLVRKLFPAVIIATDRPDKLTRLA